LQEDIKYRELERINAEFDAREQKLKQRKTDEKKFVFQPHEQFVYDAESGYEEDDLLNDFEENTQDEEESEHVRDSVEEDDKSYSHAFEITLAELSEEFSEINDDVEPENNLDSELVRVNKLENGKIERLYSCGRREVEYPNGT